MHSDSDLTDGAHLLELHLSLCGTAARDRPPLRQSDEAGETLFWVVCAAPRGHGSVLIGPHGSGAQVIAPPGTLLRTPQDDDDDAPYSSAGWRRAIWPDACIDRSRPAHHHHLALSGLANAFADSVAITQWLQERVTAQLRNQIARLRPVDGALMNHAGRERARSSFTATVLDATEAFGEPWVRGVIDPWAHLVQADCACTSL
jgi:hypothetical protein